MDAGVPEATLEVTVPVASPPEHVYDLLARSEGLDFLDGVLQERLGRVMLLIAPDAQGNTMLTILTDAPEHPAAASELEQRARSELERIERLAQEPVVDPEAAGLEAIVEDQLHGAREAPMDQEGLDR